MEAFGTFLPLILIFVVFYFLLIRPQQRKVKQHKEMLSNLKRGDKIVTSGGIIGTINKVADNRELTLEVADNVEIKIASTKNKSDCSKESPEINLINRFVSQKQKSNLSRSPPLNYLTN